MLLRFFFVLWIACWCGFVQANDEEDVQDKFTATVFAEMLINEQQASNHEEATVSREDALDFAKRALDAVEAPEEVEEVDEEQSEAEQEDDHDANETTTSEDISFTAQERVRERDDEASSSAVDPFLHKGVFEIMVDQIKMDLMPFLLLIPPPVKNYVKKISLKLIEQGKSILKGAFHPLLLAGIRIAKQGVSVLNLLTEKAHALLEKAETDYKQQYQADVEKKGEGSNAIEYSFGSVNIREGGGVEDHNNMEDELEEIIEI